MQAAIATPVSDAAQARIVPVKVAKHPTQSPFSKTNFVLVN